MIDGQNINQGTQTACNKMSVATYAEGIQYIVLIVVPSLVRLTAFVGLAVAKNK